MYVLLLNAGSSSLKCTVLAAADRTVIADSLTDWGGAVTHYRYAGPDGKERSEDVSWKGYAPAVQRVLYDLTHVEPVALPRRSALAAVGHRVVHGGQFTSSVRITPEIRSREAARCTVWTLPPRLRGMPKRLPKQPVTLPCDSPPCLLSSTMAACASGPS